MMSIRSSLNRKIVVLIVRMDDLILTADDAFDINRLKTFLSSTFEIKRSKKEIVISQRKYNLDLLKETGMSGCRPTNIPIDPNQKLANDKEGDPVNTNWHH